MRSDDLEIYSEMWTLRVSENWEMTLGDNKIEQNFSQKALRIDNWAVSIVYMEDWEQKLLPIDDYLNLTKREKQVAENYKHKWYILIGQKWSNDDYPDYIKHFMLNNWELIVDGEEKRLDRFEGKNVYQEDFQQLVFIKSNKELNNTTQDDNLLPDINEAVMKFKFWSEEILSKKLKK